MTGVFLQARISSSRLPGKALERLENRTVLEHCMAALGYVRAERHVLLTDTESAPLFAPLAEAWGFELFEGDPEDVLDRYARASERYGIETIVRATGDSPLVSITLANRIVSEHRTVNSDYSGYLGIPLGTGVEVLSARALMEADRCATEGYEREHVSPYIYRRPLEFRTHRPIVEPALQSNENVSLDTVEDLPRLRMLFSHLYRGLPIEITELLHKLCGTCPRQKRSA